MKVHRIVFRSLAILFSAVVALGLAEIAVRLARPQMTPFAGRGFYCADATVGFRLRPGRQTPGGTINSAGFRDREFTLSKPAGAYRVMACGDSFTFGAVARDEVYPKVLERRLADAFPGRVIEVINAGVPCYNTDQELRHFEKFGAPFEPDLVLLGFFVGNDVNENAETMFMRVVDGELAQEWFKPSALDRWLARSHLYRILRRRSLSAHRAGVARVGPLLASLGPPPFTDRYLEVEKERLPVCLAGRPPRRIRDGWARTEELLREFRDVVRGGGADLLVLLVPDEFQVSAALFKAIIEAKGLQASSYDLDLPQRRLRDFCEREGIDVVDVLPVFRERTERGEVLYVPEDTHWNEAGNRLAAEELLEPVAARIRRGR
jgi:lysophospholipase L1-like esterase